jgi:hypothetical protein
MENGKLEFHGLGHPFGLNATRCYSYFTDTIMASLFTLLWLLLLRCVLCLRYVAFF